MYTSTKLNDSNQPNTINSPERLAVSLFYGDMHGTQASARRPPSFGEALKRYFLAEALACFELVSPDLASLP